MPDELVVNGVLYVRADGRQEELLTASEIAEFVGKDVHSVYAAMNDGYLPYTVPNGCARPRRAKRSDVMLWLQGKSATGVG